MFLVKSFVLQSWLQCLYLHLLLEPLTIKYILRRISYVLIRDFLRHNSFNFVYKIRFSITIRTYTTEEGTVGKHFDLIYCLALILAFLNDLLLELFG